MIIPIVFAYSIILLLLILLLSKVKDDLKAFKILAKENCILAELYADALRNSQDKMRKLQSQHAYEKSKAKGDGYWEGLNRHIDVCSRQWDEIDELKTKLISRDIARKVYGQAT